MKTLLTYLSILFSLVVSAQIDSDHLNIGEVAPLITATDQKGTFIDSRELLKDHQILLIFYRGNWCPYCRKHLASLQSHLQQLKDKGIFVIVVTPEKLDKTKETGDDYNNQFSIVHDADNKIMTDYKVIYEVNELNVTRYYEKVMRNVLEYNEDSVLPVPATYLIDKSGKISYVHYDPDYTKRSDLEEILELLQ